MHVYTSDHLSIDFCEREKLLLPSWSGSKMTSEDFMAELKNYMSVLEKSKADKAIWNHTHFNFQIPSALYAWLEKAVNIPAKARGFKKLGFVLGEDVMAQFSTMDSFETSHSVFSPRYFFNSEDAIKWANSKDAGSINPFEKNIQLQVEKNSSNGMARIQIEVSIEQLPYYLKELKGFYNHQAFIFSSYQKYMMLTPREKEILHRVVLGHSNKAIAEQLFTSIHTVTTHRKHILKKLECKSLAELLRYKFMGVKTK